MNATDVMESLNLFALHGEEDGEEVFLEDIVDADGRWFRVEYRCRRDGTNARCWLLYNPWGDNPVPLEHSHLSEDGFICVGTEMASTSSPYDLAYVVPRTRTWAMAYSYVREHGFEATCEVMPEWRGT